MFGHFPPYAGDPILSLMEVYQQDTRADKVNLSIGIYMDEHGKVPVLPSVVTAEKALLAENAPHSYLPMEGHPLYRKAVLELLFGVHPECQEHIALIQTLGGSGALKEGADLISHFFPNPLIWIPDPTWDNHIGIFEGAGFTVCRYPYYDPATKGLAFDALMDTLSQLPKGDFVLLHPCCHNPTGIDPDREQWTQIIDLIEKNGVVPFFDMAYMGFAESIEADSWPVQECIRREIPFFLSTSFSKNFSLYGDRIGTLSVYCPNKKEVANVLGQLKLTVRRNYSSPAMHGALLVAKVLNDPQLKAQWVKEVEGMRVRMRDMRQALHHTLQQAIPDINFDFLLRQHGMFGYTGLTAKQVDILREQYAVYAIASGRICITGLNTSNLERVGQAFAQVFKQA